MKIQEIEKQHFGVTAELPVFFILGKGRSGSTLLELLLDAHPNIKIPFESRFFIFLFSKYSRKKKWSKKTLLGFYNDLFLDDKLNYLWEISRKDLQTRILSQPENTDFAKLFKLVNSQFISIFKKEEIKIIGDKNPINSLFFNELITVFPKAKFIHLVRDPRAVSLSHVKAFPLWSHTFASFKWKEHNLSIEKAKSRFPSQFFTLRYEDLVEDPENWLKKITRFLEIDFKPIMLHSHNAVNEQMIYKLKNEISTEKNQFKLKLFNKLHKNLSKPINKNSVDKWKIELKDAEIKRIEAIAGELMFRYNYSPKFKKEEWNEPSKMEILQFKRRMFRLKLYYYVPLFLRKAHAKYFKKGTNLPNI